MLRLPVRMRITELGDERREEGLYVECPVRHEVLSLRECLECSLAVDFPTEGDQREVLCRASQPVSDTPRRRASEVRVTEVMRPCVTCVDAGLSLSELASVFTRCGQHSLPVVDEDGRFVGIVSPHDMVRGHPREAGHPGYLPAALGVTVADVMSTPVHTVRADGTVAEAAALMTREKVSQLPVVSADDEVVGLVSGLELAAFVERGRA